MRYLIVLLGGLLIGALATVTVASVLRQRDVWPRAIMHTMEHALTGARADIRAGRCGDAELKPAIDHLALMSTDIEAALLPSGVEDKTFSRYARDLGDRVDAFAASAPACAVRSAALAKVADACDACHRDYQ